MANRLMLIAHLMNLAEHPALCGDDRTVVALHEAAQMLHTDGATVDRDERRRAKDRLRPPRGRPTNPRISEESTETVDASNGFPAPFLNSKADNTTPRATEYEEAVLLNTDLLRGQMGDALFPDADAFVRRRPYATWKAWIKEMLTVLTGGQATPADVAQVCRDDEALARKIDTPKGLRIFVASAVQERLHGRQQPTNGKHPVRGQKAPPQRYDYPEPTKEPKWQT